MAILMIPFQDPFPHLGVSTGDLAHRSISPSVFHDDERPELRYRVFTVVHDLFARTIFVV